ncbi:cobalamin-binding protein [Heyndrickxia sp. NPDC080065]|uniref:cobalamin-binding protein n=1 Tax=Heyndrickxia sp. NPDC080065 TaxID=3390568 RepID=UPI003CFCBA14
MRVVSICPSNTELLAYLDALPLLVGIDDYSDWPESIKSLPRLGPDLSIRMDDVEKLKPDLVLASLSVPGMEKNIDELNKRKIPYIVLDPQNFEDIANNLIEVSRAIGMEEIGIRKSAAFLNQLNEFKKIASTIENRPSLYWEWWPKPVFTPGKINWLTKVSEYVGAYNIFADIEEASIQTDWDDVATRNPDYICLAWVGVSHQKVKPELVQKRPDWNQLPAVKNNRILVLEEYLYCRPSPRLIKGIEKLGKILHPAAFEQLEIEPLFDK